MNQSKRAAIRRWYWIRRHVRAKRRVYRGQDYLGRATFVILRYGQIEIRTQRRALGFDVIRADDAVAGDWSFRKDGRRVTIDERDLPLVRLFNNTCGRKRSWAPKAGGVQ